MKDLLNVMPLRDKPKHHQGVKEKTLIEKALAPDGIPGEILVSALKPINENKPANPSRNTLKRLLALLFAWRNSNVPTDRNLRHRNNGPAALQGPKR
ncbi:hypothetical protein K3169_11055 [Pseudomonas phytophila]|uniref:Uncharacterized protein n=1 Tax=Pseudomonas phytophila TaxID=2867264 RepID=A0ABY6FKB9_9PSED|nr:hypothetical protein [Pseudomonas phytophila]UXZ98353.1 hypothetical protein K3169_11055 [Pseudomonas phytophila]